MIKITRLTEPTILRRKARDWTQALCDERRAYYRDLERFTRGELSKKPRYPRAKKPHYGHKEIKVRLKGMFEEKCAYCESRVTAVSYPHIEHFQPQSIYPKLAYNWENLLLACEVCNSGYKGDKFPLQDGSQPAEDEINPCSHDRANNHALIDPCSDDPENFFHFVDEQIVCRNARATHTMRVCGLDREALNDARRALLELVEVVAKAFIAANRDGRDVEMREFASTLKKSVSPSAPYSAMIKSKLKALDIYSVIQRSVCFVTLFLRYFPCCEAGINGPGPQYCAPADTIATPRD